MPFPGMSKHVNDNAHMLIRLREKGLNIVIITGKSMALKGSGNLPDYEDMDGIPIYRLYDDPQEMFLFPGRKLEQILAIAKDLKPDLIFCEPELNIRLALLLQKHLGKPIALMVENAGRILSGEMHNSIKMKTIMSVLGIPTGPNFWSWLCEKADLLITCSPRDQENLGNLSKHGKPVFYLPWPSYVPEDFKESSAREYGRGIYIGSLYPFKNTQEFGKTLPLILDNTKTKEFCVVGSGPDYSIIKKISQKCGQSLRYVKHLSRIESLQLMSNSFYAYTPVIIGGWGFIGDCWSTRTPIVMTHNDDYVINGVNALVADSEDAVAETINRLYSDPELYRSLQAKGYEEYERRKSTVVGDRLYNILTQNF